MSGNLPHEPPRQAAALVFDLSSRRLPLVPRRIMSAGRRFFRFYGVEHPDPLGVGRSSARFSDPRFCSGDDRFNVLFGARSLQTGFEETILRDRSDGERPAFPISRKELAGWKVAILELVRPLALVDVFSSGGRRYTGMPTDVVRASSHRPSRVYSLGFHKNDVHPDGLLFPSRFDGTPNLLVYDRALQSCLRPVGEPLSLLDIDLGEILVNLHVAVVDPEE